MTTKSKYEMWLTFNGEKEKLKIAVLPEKLDITCGSANDSVKVADLGEVTIIQGRPAYKFAFSSFFPKHKFQGISPSGTPQSCVDKILKWKNSGKPIHFIVAGFKVDTFCTIENFSYYEQGGDVGTIYFSLSLKEYREIKARKVKVDTSTKKASVSSAPARVNNTTNPKTYTVVAGDCLWTIAQKFYGDGSKWEKIYNANTDVCGKPYTQGGVTYAMIYAGDVLKIPD